MILPRRFITREPGSRTPADREPFVQFPRLLEWCKVNVDEEIIGDEQELRDLNLRSYIIVTDVEFHVTTKRKASSRKNTATGTHVQIPILYHMRVQEDSNPL